MKTIHRIITLLVVLLTAATGAGAQTTYDLTVDESSYGTVATTVAGVPATEADAGDVVTVTVTPSKGYAVRDLTVRAYTSWGGTRTRSGSPELLDKITVTAGATAGTWTFTMPEANVWIVATYTRVLQDAWIQDIADVTYTGSEQKPAITVKDGTTTLTGTTDYTVSYSNNVNAGTATVTVTAATGSDKYSGSAKATFTIVKATPTVTAPTAKTLTYTGSAQALVTAGSTSGGTMQYSLDGKTYATTLPTATTVGTYTIYYKVVGDANYNDVAVATVKATIAAADKTVLSTAINAANTYYNSIKDDYAAIAATLQGAIDEAKAVLANDNVTPEAIANAATKLNAAVETAKAEVDKAIATAATAMIEAIGEVEYTDESKAKIDAARDAYDALTDAQKALVSDETLKILTDAEEKYAELKEEAESAQNIFILKTENGEVVSNVLFAKPGQQVNLKVIADEGCELVELSVVNNEGEKLTVNTIEDPTEGLIYYFLMRGERVNIYATFKAPDAPEPSQNIFIFKAENGEIISNLLYAAPDETVVLVAKPEPDYELDELKVINDANEELKVMTAADVNTFYFIMKGESAKIYSSFKSTKAPEPNPDPTSVNGIQAGAADADIYDLSGRKVNSASLRKGIYIKNGKKILIK